MTEELLSLLEDFKQKSYSLHEMEALFENWRRKAEVSILIKKKTKVASYIRKSKREVVAKSYMTNGLLIYE